MFDKNRWQIPKHDEKLVKSLSDSLRIHPLCAKLLINRGYTELENAKAFIQKSDAFLYNPYYLKDIKKATNRIRRALDNDEKITIYGDYDVDGVTSVSILYMYLKDRGADVDFYIPTREHEGYGLNINAFHTIKENGTKLVITVDTGITAIDEIAYAKTIGLDVVVTDHHQCRPELPECEAVVNPRRLDCQYPFKELSGVGVIFKVLCALEMDILNFGEYNIFTVKDMCRRYIDLVTIGTIADVMPLYDENRIMVYMGLNLLSSTGNLGVRALIRAVGMDDSKKITSSTVGYTLAPRLNAAGRIGNASRAVQLFLTDSPHTANVIAEELCAINKERQQTENLIFEEALKQIEEEHDIEKESVIVLASSHWHQGVIGIVASKITELFGKPSILISFDTTEPSEFDIGKGSARSIKGLNIVEALSGCEHLLVKYGGHELAAGLSIERKNLKTFREELNAFALEHLSSSESLLKTFAEAEISEKDVTIETVMNVSQLEPYGAKNPEPIFVLKDVLIEEIAPLSMGKHTRLFFRKNHIGISAVCFGHNLLNEGFSNGHYADVLCSLNINEFRGNRTVQLIIRDIDYSDKILYEMEEYENRFLQLKNGKCFFNSQDIPKREDFALLYKWIRDENYKKEKTLTLMKLKSVFSAFNYLKILIMLETFQECDLITWKKISIGKYRICQLETKEKKNLYAAPIMKLLIQ
ncbi:MAG: single-stranded-DNA-specific exonuclease RecJ [Ruminococcaceae bacterium]|nr:single-stranded-DNA-specific exonuclease RecJ [Oscillospiraceae bacterium]